MNKPRNRIGAISLAVAGAGFLLVTLQPWLPLERIVLYGDLNLKRLLVALFDASLVGALADWFAVSALFRNPLGVKLPHTDILAKNRDSIAEAVPRFLTGFLAEENVSTELARLDYGAKLGELLVRPGFAAELARFVLEKAERLLPPGASSNGERGAALAETLSGLTARLLGFLAERSDLARPVAGIVRIAVRENLHERLISGAARLLRSSVGENRERLVDILTPLIRHNSGWQGIFVGRRVVERLVDGIKEELDRIRDEPNHEIRRILARSLVSYLSKLSDDGPGGESARVAISERIRRALTDPTIQAASGRLLASMVDRLREDLASPESITRQGVERLAKELGSRLASDEPLRARFNREVGGLIFAIVSKSRLIDGASSYLASLLKSTDVKEFVDRIEEAVWNDLQYIRLNGAVVGGLVGLVLAVITALL